jgi:hypothetical protein
VGEPIKILGDEGVQFLQEMLEISKETDSINLTADSANDLIALWRNDKKTDSFSVPSDLFFNNTIPLRNCQITVNDNFSYRVIIFHGYEEKVKDINNGDAACVGVLELHGEKKAVIIHPILVIHGMDTVEIGAVAPPKNVDVEEYEKIIKDTPFMELYQWSFLAISTWYGIQIALLHPVVRDVFNSPRTMKVKEKSGVKGKKRIVRYIKRHIVNPKQLESAIYGENKAFNRHALIWYVIGHWRKYPDGRKVFIQPYWKGALRETKKPIENRERQIIHKKESIANA